jgi:DNA-binding transcriptional MocR family regulator
MGDLMATLRAVKTPLYLKLAHTLEQQIARGVLRPGDRVPSVRSLSRQQGVSISTVLEAYMWLENRGAIESRPQSGFFVRLPFANSVPEPRFQTPQPRPANFGAGAIVAEVVRSANNPGMVPMGSALPDPELLPNRKLNQITRGIIRRAPLHSATYAFSPGIEALRRQIARRSLAYGCNFSPSEIVVTSGAMEALNLSLRAVARAGDVIAVESPTYFGVLEAIQSLGMRAIEIPTHPSEGMSFDLLESAVRKHRIKACVAMTNGHNPLGYVLPDDHKKRLAEFTATTDVALIEDNIYGDLAFGGRQPKVAKVFDRTGNVLLCSSFSKVLAPGFRVGWMQAGRYQGEVERLKFMNTVATASLPQLVIAEYLESGGYDRYLTRLRIAFAEQVRITSQAAAKYFPEGTRITRPDAGYLLWVELPKRVDAVKLFRAALAANISVVPGPIFSASGRFRNCIRISCGYRWSDTIDRALLTLGRLAGEAGS